MWANRDGVSREFSIFRCLSPGEANAAKMTRGERTGAVGGCGGRGAGLTIESAQTHCGFVDERVFAGVRKFFAGAPTSLHVSLDAHPVLVAIGGARGSVKLRRGPPGWHEMGQHGLGGLLPTARGKGQFGWGWCGGGDSAGRRVSGGGKVSRGPVEHTNRQNQRRRRCVAARNAWAYKGTSWLSASRAASRSEAVAVS